MSTTSSDILLAGAGLSGLTLALELARQPAFRDKRILLLDRDNKTRNDRTWSFWATPHEPLPPTVHRVWPRARFAAQGTEHAMDMGAYRYHTVRGIDYYQWAHAELSAHPNVQRVQATIQHIDKEMGAVVTDRGVFQAPVVFNSAFTPSPLIPADVRFPSPFSDNGKQASSRFTRLLQHFKGWFIRTDTPVFDPEEVRFMDFRVTQDGAVRFVYVLPFSETEALVEYTLFSPELLPDDQYDAALKHYISHFLNIRQYSIRETEFGVIPMTDDPFRPRQHGRVWNIGTAAGFVKPSSGYAFKRTLRKMNAFAAHWAQAGAPDARFFDSPWRFRAYDSILLRVLRDQPELGQRVFNGLFSKLSAHQVLRFLDEDTTFAQELNVMRSVPMRHFVQAAFQQVSTLSNL